MRKKENEVTLLLIRGAGKENISVRIKYSLMWALTVIFCLFVISLFAFIANYGTITEKAFVIKSIIKENSELRQKVQKIAQIYDELDMLKEYEKKLKILTRNYDETSGQKDSSSLEEKEGLLNEMEIDKFVKNIKIRRNINFLSQKDDLSKRKLILESLPNILPVDGWISKGFEEKSESGKKDHFGLDIAAAYESRIKAAGPGIVTYDGWKEDLGNMVEIDHGYGFVTRYGHCAAILVHKGDLVDRSQAIATVGSSGRSSAPHLHFELIKDGKYEDPLKYIYK